MKKEIRRNFSIATGMLFMFLLWTAALRLIDVQPIGPHGSTVGFATINRFVHGLTGVHMAVYAVTDWLSLVPFLFVMGFGIRGLVQWIRRKHIRKVDHEILALGGFYVVVILVYILFETVVINYRPVLINGALEASYPSSTTMLVLCVMPTAAMQLPIHSKNGVFKRCVTCAMTVFTVLTVMARLVSGVHWFTDIVGGVFLSAGLVLLYRAILRCKIS